MAKFEEEAEVTATFIHPITDEPEEYFGVVNWDESQQINLILLPDYGISMPFNAFERVAAKSLIWTKEDGIVCERMERTK